MNKINDLCKLAPVIPVLVIEDLTTAKPLAEALVKGGLPVLEVTLRTPASLDAIRLMSEVPGAIVGVGTLLTPRDVTSAKSAGAVFGVSPGVTDALLDAVEIEQLPLLPGAATASEVMQLRERGYDTLKFFPAQAAGGVNMLRSFAGPLPQVSFCPTGGVNPQNVEEYLALPNVLCVGGTWITTRERIQARDWQSIESQARLASTFGA